MAMKTYKRADEVAERLRVSTRAVQQWAKSGRIPSVRLGPKTIRFDIDAIFAALDRESRSDSGASGA